MRVLKKVFSVLWISVIVMTIGFGIHQMFFDKVDADLFRCKWEYHCTSTQEMCSDSIACQCTNLGYPSGYPRCQIHFEPQQ